MVEKRKSILNILVIILLALIVVVILFWIMPKPLNEGNGFTRILFSDYLKAKSVQGKPNDVTHIAGFTNDSIYFQSNRADKLYSSTLKLEGFNHRTLKLSVNDTLTSLFRIQVLFPYLYIYGSNVPTIIRYDLQNDTCWSRPMQSPFIRAVNISANTFVVRGVAENQSWHVFKNISLSDNQEKISDSGNWDGSNGVIKTDGLLYYDTATQNLCYTFFYQNGFLCMDTTLQNTVLHKTIDNVITNRSTVAHVSSTYTLSSAPQIVSYEGCVYNGILFLQSAVKGDNERSDIFNRNSVIDVYRLKNGKYIGSFYIPPFKNEKALKFRRYQDILLVLYKSNVVAYSLTKEI
ncbi:hypothetical protein [Parapedobacter sp. 10938]|uniref:hypothetical protein n=1 Tax=Parapedobacter flavus TaxID=3110225 RepID=UPI002DB9D10A|nr:hypothetical protein [Parapedobacter sp. 10938]MEC3880211.1 hypothetical protein [Parapedobacter sp. 10938]